MKRVLIACEESQMITIEMRKLGIEAYSCDIEPCSGNHPEWHIQDDVLKHLNNNWDLMIAHPPCTYLSNVGIAWFNEEKYGDKARERKRKREEAFKFVLNLYNAPIYRIAIENPVGYLNSNFKKPTQIFQPYDFGDKESKRTCLWLKNLPKLKPTKIVKPNIHNYRKTGIGIGRPLYYVDRIKDKKIRSKTFPGVAKAFATQYMAFINSRMTVSEWENLFKGIDISKSNAIINKYVQL